MDNRERARTRAKKHQTKETKFVGRKFYCGGEKIRNASSHQGENEQQEKNANKKKQTKAHATLISPIKHVTRKFRVVVMKKKKKMAKKCTKKCAARPKWFFC